jgi:hypothetical protein
MRCWFSLILRDISIYYVATYCSGCSGPKIDQEQTLCDDLKMCYINDEMIDDESRINVFQGQPIRDSQFIILNVIREILTYRARFVARLQNIGRFMDIRLRACIAAQSYSEGDTLYFMHQTVHLTVDEMREVCAIRDKFDTRNIMREIEAALDNTPFMHKIQHSHNCENIFTCAINMETGDAVFEYIREPTIATNMI